MRVIRSSAKRSEASVPRRYLPDMQPGGRGAWSARTEQLPRARRESVPPQRHSRSGTSGALGGGNRVRRRRCLLAKDGAISMQRAGLNRKRRRPALVGCSSDCGRLANWDMAQFRLGLRGGQARWPSARSSSPFGFSRPGALNDLPQLIYFGLRCDGSVFRRSATECSRRDPR